MKNLLLVCNWKMNPKTEAEARTLAHAIVSVAGAYKKNIVILPPAVFLCAVKKIHPQVGTQDVSEHKDGAHTGQISARMAKTAGARYAVIGHSERRREQHETDACVARKILRSREAGLIPIVCVGEKKKKDVTHARLELRSQLDIYIPVLQRTRRYMIAYEPAWAIGGNKTAPGTYIQKMTDYIRAYMRAKGIVSPIVLYGGSVDSASIKSLLHYHNSMDGFLVGSASVQKKEIINIIKTTYGIV